MDRARIYLRATLPAEIRSRDQTTSRILTIFASHSLHHVALSCARKVFHKGEEGEGKKKRKERRKKERKRGEKGGGRRRRRRRKCIIRSIARGRFTHVEPVHRVSKARCVERCCNFIDAHGKGSLKIVRNYPGARSLNCCEEIEFVYLE